MKRALLLGSQIHGLHGSHGDTARMAEMLEARGFQIDRRIGERATRAGILAGYDALIDACSAEDAAVVYYSGHGFRARIASERLRSWQCIAPTDVDESTNDDWRGITAWELSIKQAQLTARTRNVTVILDCCYASQMSRDAATHAATPRALPHPVKLGFEAHLAALRSSYRSAYAAVDPGGNLDAVRLAACGDTEVAFEYANAAGVVQGAFTIALLELLREVGDSPVSWDVLGDVLAARVQRRFVRQRPEIEGPRRRRLFSLVEDETSAVVSIHAVGDGFALPVGRLHAVTVGDIYGVMPMGSRSYAPGAALAELEVTEVQALTATAKIRTSHREVPAEASALAIRRQVPRRAVAVEAPGAQRATVEQAILAAPTLRLAAVGETDPVATLRLVNDVLTIEDAGGPLFPAMRFPADLASAIKNVVNLAVAQSLRELEGAHGVLATELGIELGAVHRGVELPLPEHGASLGLRDRIYVKVVLRGRRRLLVHAFNVGVRGKVTFLSRFAPSGISLDEGDPPFVLGRTATGTSLGLGLAWPDGLPRRTLPRLDELFIIATTAKTSLRGLETQEAPGTMRLHDSQLTDLLAQLQRGERRDLSHVQATDGFLVKRLSYLLHPREAAMAGPPFEIDERRTGR